MTESSGSLCKTPTRHFGINFQPSNDFEKGLGVAIIVDGVLCTSKDAAKALVIKRIDELHTQWAAQIEKM
jgi:hypothetical protein